MLAACLGGRRNGTRICSGSGENHSMIVRNMSQTQKRPSHLYGAMWIPDNFKNRSFEGPESHKTAPLQNLPFGASIKSPPLINAQDNLKFYKRIFILPHYFFLWINDLRCRLSTGACPNFFVLLCVFLFMISFVKWIFHKK